MYLDLEIIYIKNMSYCVNVFYERYISDLRMVAESNQLQKSYHKTNIDLHSKTTNIELAMLQKIQHYENIVMI